MVSIHLRIRWSDLSGFETSMLMLQPGHKAAGILCVEGNGFGGEIRATMQLFLPSSNFMPHESSLLSAQLDYRRSF